MTSPMPNRSPVHFLPARALTRRVWPRAAAGSFWRWMESYVAEPLVALALVFAPLTGLWGPWFLALIN